MSHTADRLFLLFCAGLGLAQSPQGTIVGTVTDQSQAVIANAKITVRNQLTGVARDIAVTSAGAYTAPFLPVGTYEVLVQASGMKRFIARDVQLNTGHTVRVDAVLEVGQIENVITVSAADTALIETEKPTLSNTLSNRELLALPAANRYFMNYIALTPGTTGASQTVINGGQRLGVNFVMDGVNVRDRVRGEFTADSGAGPSLDSLEEVNIKTSTASTDTGLGTAEIHLTTKSGTNRFHGNLFEYYKGNLAEARNAFNPTSKIPRQVRNQFGGSLGGPIVRDRTFFFLNYDAIELRLGATTNWTVPTALMRQGNFSEQPVILRDISSSNQVATQTPFPGNTIPQSRLDPTAQGILEFFQYPLPNRPGLVNNLFSSPVGPRYNRQITARVDHRFSDTDNMYVRVWRQWQKVTIPQGWNNAYAVATIDIPTANINATWIRILTPTITNEVRFGFFDFPRTIQPTDLGDDVYSRLGVTGVNVVDPELQSFGPRFNFGGVGSALFMGEGVSFPQFLGSRTYNFNNTLNVARRRHSLRFGAQSTIGHTPFFSTSNVRGTINYTGANSPVSTGYAFADFLLGAPATSTLADPHPIRDLRDRMVGLFVTDDWKAMASLTLTFGVRWEYLSPLSEAGDTGLAGYDRYARAVVINSESIPQGIPARVGSGAGVPVVTSRSLGLGRALQRPDYNNLAPRFGFAWRSFGGGKTVLRGGYGIYFSETAVLFTARQTFNPPFTFSRSFVSDVGQRLTTEAPFVAGSLQAPSFTSFDRDIRSQYTQQWNISLERVLVPETSLRVSYVGSKAAKLWVTQNIGQVLSISRAAPGGALIREFPIPELSSLTNWNSIGNSVYHSMQTEVRKRWSKGFELKGHWTWAKHIDDDTDSGLPLNSLNLRNERADSIYTPRHVTTFVGIYDVPLGRNRRFLSNVAGLVDSVLGGWQISGISRWYTGRFITPSYTNPIGEGGNRPNRASGVDIIDGAPADRWFNPAAFAPVVIDADRPSLSFGNSARNVIPTPSALNVDLSLSKRFQIREGHLLTVRGEAFNAPNVVNLGLPNTNISDAVNVGRITSATAARSFQWSLRYDF